LPVEGGLGKCISYLRADDTKMTPHNPFLLELGLLTPSFSARYGRSGKFFGGPSDSMYGVSDSTYLSENMVWISVVCGGPILP